MNPLRKRADRFNGGLPTDVASVVTPQEVFLDRRKFMTTAAIGLAGASSALSQTAGGSKKLTPPISRPDVFPAKKNSKYSLPKTVDSKLTPRDVAGSHNNFYEFLAGQGGPVWRYVDDYVVDPWKIEVTGEVENPLTLDLDDLFAFEHEERLYHFRCVERWAMNVPWSGFELSKLLERAKPSSKAKYVRFISASVPEQMPGLAKSDYYPWPYHEGLRLDEAMNELAFVVTGVYGEPLLKQHGAPVRIAVPWKYGYKSPKAIVKIELTTEEPKTFWQVQAHEYGFLSNVNPYIPHPRWSQAVSYWLDTQEKFSTPFFNGYADYVEALYPDEPKTMQQPLRPGQIAR